MRLYHITNKEYQIEEVVSIYHFEVNVCYYHQNHPTHQWINDYLDSYKPAECPSRKKCIYAFDKPGHSFAFLYGMSLVGQHCYEIEMDAYGGFPMILTGLFQTFKNNVNVLNSMAEEYWHPTQEWKFCEYLGREMRIVSEVKKDIIACAASGYHYIMDGNKAKDMFRHPSNT